MRANARASRVGWVLGLAVWLAAAGAAPAYELTWWTIDATSTSGSGGWALTATAGQAEASLSGSRPWRLVGGFWGGETAATPGLRGDANGDGMLAVADSFYLIDHLLGAGPAPASACGGDANDDGALTVADVFFLLRFLLAGGAAPSAC